MNIQFGMSLLMVLGLGACSKSDDDEKKTGTFTLKGSGPSATAELTLAGVDASVAKMKVYRFAVSKNQDCSDAKVVIDNGSSAESVDMFKGPDLGSGALEDGDYPCAIIEMSDQLVFTPKTDHGICSAGESYTIDVCGPRGETEPAPKTKSIEGKSITCTSEEDKVTLYLSTLSVVENGSDAACEADSENCNAFLPPTTSIKVQGIKLGKALAVSGDTSGEFVIDLSGKINGLNEEGTANSDQCDLQPPAFSFAM